MESDTTKKPIELNANPSIPTVFIDAIQTLRRSDDHCILRLFTGLPEGSFEQSRMILTKKNFLEFLENSCKLFNHYPKAPEVEEKPH